MALAECWSCTKLCRANRRFKMIGKIATEIGCTSGEARALRRSLCVYEAGLDAWIDHSRHVFYFRDLAFDRGLIKGADERFGLLSRIRHMIINPRDWPRLWDIISLLATRCQSLETLVIVAPWFTIAEVLGAGFGMDYAPYEDWGPIFDQSPNELNLRRLFRDIADGGVGNAMRNAQYLAQLEEACQLIPDTMDVDEHVLGIILIALQKLEDKVSKFTTTKPRLYLRSVAQLQPGYAPASLS